MYDPEDDVEITIKCGCKVTINDRVLFTLQFGTDFYKIEDWLIDHGHIVDGKCAQCGAVLIKERHRAM